MGNNISPREWQSLSEYLDGVLDPRSRKRLEARLSASPELRQALDALRRTRSVLRSAPRLRAPRNFLLTPAMAGIKISRSPRSYPVLRLAFAVALLLLFIFVAGDLWSSRPASSPAPEMLAVMEAAEVEITSEVEAKVPQPTAPEETSVEEAPVSAPKRMEQPTATPEVMATMAPLQALVPPPESIAPTATEEILLSMEMAVEEPTSESPISEQAMETEPTEPSELEKDLGPRQEIPTEVPRQPVAPLTQKSFLGIPVWVMRIVEILLLMVVLTVGLLFIFSRKPVPKKK